MILKCHSKQASASIGEYILVFSLVVAVFAGMTSFVQRSFQGRMQSSRHYMVENLRDQCRDTNCVGQGAIGEGYEPYYTQVNSEVQSESVSHKGLLGTGVGTTGNFISRVSERNQSQSQSEQLAPMNAVDDKVLGRR